MAYMSISSTGRENTVVYMLDLQYTTDQYTFEWSWWKTAYPADKAIWTFNGDSNYYKSVGVNLGGLYPSTGYTFQCRIQYPKNTGTWYTFSATSTTTGITEPSASQYLPTYYPSVRTQEIYNSSGTYIGEAGSCVAQTYSAALDILEYRERGTNNNYYSAVWIYGNRTVDGGTGEGMQFYDSINKLVSDGTPIWNRMPTINYFPDNRYWDDYSGVTGAKNLVINNYSNLLPQAKTQKVSCIRDSYNNPENVSFFDCQRIANSIQTYGFFIIGLGIPSVWDSPNSNGTVSNPTSSSQRGGHAALLIGWKTINSKKYWIVQNSWGTWWGDGGRCYLPMDWGIGTSRAYDSGGYYFNWVYSGYELINAIAPVPSTPSSPTLKTIGRVDGGLDLQWNNVDYGDDYTLRYKHYSGIYYTVTSTTNSYKLTGLEYGVSYYVSVRANNYKGSSAYSSENTATTAPKIPTIAKNSVGLTTLTVDISGMVGGWSYIKLWYRETGGTWYSITVTSPSLQGTITGLTQGKTYEVKASSFFTVSGVDIESKDANGNTGYSNLLTTQISSRPQNFSWTTSIVAGGSVKSVSGKVLYIVSATEWNDFTARINAFRQYKGLSTYAFTTVATNTDFTATIFNQARNALNDLSGSFTGGNTIPAVQSTGGRIYAQYFINMKNALNSIT